MASRQLSVKSGKDVFAAFEGGGAKGIVHVGALRAMEERNFNFLGVAGTSAGAIIASLIAVGYKSDELFDGKARTHILQNLPRRRYFSLKHPFQRGTRDYNVRDVFGAFGWSKIRFIYLLSRSIKTQNISLYLHSAIFFLICLILIFYFEDLEDVALYTGVFSATICIILLYVIGLSINQILKGINSVRNFRDNLDLLLNNKLFPDDPDRRVVMGDFGVAGRPALKIVASDIKNKKLRLFSSSAPEDRDTPVADAVAASICLPIVFKPFPLGDAWFLDGGMVSNLPIWPFDTERALDPNAVTIAVEIVQKTTVNSNSSFGISSVIETALFGASILNLRAVSDLVTIRLPTSLETMGFGASYDTFFQEIEAATQYARAQISSQVEDFPNLCRSAGESAQQLVFDVLSVIAWPKNVDAEKLYRVRVSLALPEGDNVSSLRIKHCIGYENDFDENILLPIDESVVGYSWKTSEILFECLPLRSDIDLAASRSNATRKRVPKDLKWFFAIPIFEDPGDGMAPKRPEFVVAIDGTGEFIAGCDLVRIKEILAPRIANLYDPVVALAREIRNAEAASGPWL